MPSLPTKTKTWQYNVNQLIAPGAAILDTARLTMLAIVNSMLGFATEPWTVDYSCSSTVAGSAGDGINRWASVSNLVWGSTTRSWIVLKQSELAGAELCIDLSNATASSCTVAFSPGGLYTGGTTTARPTATDEVVLLSNTTWMPSTTNLGNVVHVQQSTDGKATRVLICQLGMCGTFFMMQEVADYSTGWTHPVVGTWTANNAAAAVDRTTYAVLNDLAALSARDNGTNFALFMATKGFISAMVGEQLNAVANEIDGTWPLTDIDVESTTSLKRGQHGYLDDLWFGSSNHLTGTAYPTGGTREFAQFGHLVTPWNGSTIRTVY